MTPREVAAMLEAVAEWADVELAGHTPAKWVAAQAVQAIRYISSALRTGELP